MRMQPLTKTVQDYIKIAPKETQAMLKTLRVTITKAVPHATEQISYRIPMYKVYGKQFVAFGWAKQHVSLYAMTGTLFEKFKKEAKKYSTSKGTIRFPLGTKVPVSLVRSLLKERLKAFTAKKKK